MPEQLLVRDPSQNTPVVAATQAECSIYSDQLVSSPVSPTPLSLMLLPSDAQAVCHQNEAYLDRAASQSYQAGI